MANRLLTRWLVRHLASCSGCTATAAPSVGQAPTHGISAPDMRPTDEPPLRPTEGVTVRPVCRANADAACGEQASLTRQTTAALVAEYDCPDLPAAEARLRTLLRTYTDLAGLASEMGEVVEFEVGHAVTIWPQGQELPPLHLTLHLCVDPHAGDHAADAAAKVPVPRGSQG